MRKENKSVYKRLDNIESTLKANKQKNNKQKRESISDIIGMPFSEYIANSTIYLFERDERKFKRNHKNSNVVFSILSIVFGILLIFNIVKFVINQGQEWYFIISSSFATLNFIFLLIVSLNQKEKMKSKSFWSLTKIEFYLSTYNETSTLNKEKRKSLLNIILLAYIFSNIVLSGLLVLFYLIFNKNTGNIDWLVASINMIFTLAIVISLSSYLKHFGYYYPETIIEYNNSYFIYPSMDYHKKEGQ